MSCCTTHRRVLAPPVIALLLCLSAAALAQGDEVTFELGFGGEVVAGAWNPMRVLVRDHPGSSLEVRIDQGSLRAGVIPLVYRADIGGGTGLSVFEDDLFIPQWRRLTWAVSSGGATIASGSYAPGQRLDERPLHLLLSRNPGAWRSLYGEGARLSEIAALALPERTAAFDGVASLLIDGTAVPPRLGAIAAAATAGVNVLMVSELPASHSELLLLAPAARQRLGEGWLLRGDPTLSTKLLPTLPLVEGGALVELLAVTDPVQGPKPVAQLFVLIAAGAYGLLVLVLIRFAGTPGLLAGVGLAAVVSVAAWRALRPDQPLERTSHSIDIGGGDLAHRVAVEHLFSLPEGSVELEAVFRPLRPRPLEVGPGSTALDLKRWQSETLIARPQLVPATLAWEGGELVNRGNTPITTLFVSGLGPQASLAAGGRMTPSVGEERTLSLTLESLLEALPRGTAIAQIGSRYAVALPLPRDAASVGRR